MLGHLDSMETNPLLSIVTVVFNNESCILRCIDSVDAQANRSEIEYIVIDGMSTDNTFHIVKANMSKIDGLIRESLMAFMMR